jgi:ATP-dependent helicase/nuclease subunit A
VYVAFTRAMVVLRVIMPSVHTEAGIGKFVASSVMRLTEQPGFSSSWDEANQVFSYGSLPETGKEQGDQQKNKAAGWFFRDFTDQLHLRSESDNFFEQSETGEVLKDKGNTLHSILSGIVVATDVEPACLKALASGLLPPEELDETREKLSSMVGHPLVSKWFNGHYRVFTETDLLTAADTYRPDRMMIKGNEAVVVDYKTGVSRPESHARQVRRYVSLLKGTGIPEVKGYLWYIRDNDLVEV